MPPFDDKIREVAAAWTWRPPRIFTDPIDMEYKLADEIQKELSVVRLETFGAIHESFAKGFARAAELVARGKTAG
jgi:hypothetical protein